MTAGSIELFPMRVAPINKNLPVNPTNQTHPATLWLDSQFLISKQRVCRNLFGSVEPGSTEIERRNEEQMKVAEWKRRFNVDLNSMKIVGNAFSSSQQESKAHSERKLLPNLIEQEQREYEKRLALIKQNNLNEVENEQEKEVEVEEKCNSTIEKIRESAETTPQQPHRSNNNSNNNNLNNCNGTTTTTATASSTLATTIPITIKAAKHRNHSNETHSLTTSPRRIPYARQKLISECFTTRRKPSSSSSSSSASLSAFQHSFIERQKLWLDSRDESSESSDTFLLNLSSSPSSTMAAATRESKKLSSSDNMQQQLKRT